MTGSASGQAQPARRQDTRKMAVTEDQDIAIDSPQSGDHTVGTGADGLDRLTTGTAVIKERPAGPLLADVSGASAFVLAIIPFLQVWVDCGLVAEPRQLARPGEAAAEGLPGP
jgi:hypothetical protein